MIVAAVPMKRLGLSKSRLAPHLAASERQALALAMLERTLGALRDSESIHRMALVTPERALADVLGVEVLYDEGDLNAAVAGAIHWAVSLRAQRLLVLPADLPLISANAVEGLIHTGFATPGIVIVKTRDGGTGALLLTPPDVIEPAFGLNSFERHVARAQDQSVSVRIISIAALETDLDTIEDVQALDPASAGTHQRTIQIRSME